MNPWKSESKIITVAVVGVGEVITQGRQELGDRLERGRPLFMLPPPHFIRREPHGGA